jgi:hypothetical protein
VRVGPRQVLGADLDPPRLVDALKDDSALLRVDLCDLPTLAVVDLGLAVVDAGNDLIASGEASVPDFDLLGSELSLLAPELSRHRVQPLDVEVSLGDHHRVLATVVGLVPGLHHRLAPRLRVGSDRDSVLGLIET